MARFLFVVPPMVGHINPNVGTAAALVARGHEVAWAGHADLLRRLTGQSAYVFPCAGPPELLDRPATMRGPAALKYLWSQYLMSLAVAMAPGVRAALDEFDPDVVVADSFGLAGSLVAAADGRCWITSATSATSSTAPLIDPLAGMPKVADWVTSQIAEIRDRIAPGAGSADPRWSPHGVLAYTTRALIGPVELPDQVWLVGPSIADRPTTTDFPWEWLTPDLPTVLITLGTVNTDLAARFLRLAVDAVPDTWRAVIVDPGGHLPKTPPHVLVRRWVPQLELMPHLSAVLCHAGHNTVCEALWHGQPLVVAPIRDDQPLMADRVVSAGAGVRLRFGRATTTRIRAAVDQVLTESSHVAAAKEVARSFRAAGGSAAAADKLEFSVRHR